MQRYLEPSNYLNHCDQKEKKNGKLGPKGKIIFHDHVGFTEKKRNWLQTSIILRVTCPVKE